MIEIPQWRAYKWQSEILRAEKLKLQELNKQLLTARKTCNHVFVNGACQHCGQNEDVFKLDKNGT